MTLQDLMLPRDGIYVDNLRMQGRSLAWENHTMADRYIGYTSVEAGTAALKASDFKNEKYVSLNNLSKIFQPICIETFGPTDKDTSLFIKELTRKIVNITGDPNEDNYLKQTLPLYYKNLIPFAFWMELLDT
ncbi:hypothetical protein HELRODRAFT_172095 [Helobdella robusta]|uniref:Uncharacterized protein n=1 Tax=Helobdella robusta TaxID=6412 RepID=T1F507_HELRO|nr:hypothetical protein HELRODRAFT_172095 [Helobdella robusta]ESO05078.1 hypothetical protein HELRODRAFT_172095 [Helobdella robusta]